MWPLLLLFTIYDSVFVYALAISYEMRGSGVWDVVLVRLVTGIVVCLVTCYSPWPVLQPFPKFLCVITYLLLFALAELWAVTQTCSEPMLRYMLIVSLSVDSFMILVFICLFAYAHFRAT